MLFLEKNEMATHFATNLTFFTFIGKLKLKKIIRMGFSQVVRQRHLVALETLNYSFNILRLSIKQVITVCTSLSTIFD